MVTFRHGHLKNARRWPPLRGMSVETIERLPNETISIRNRLDFGNSADDPARRRFREATGSPHDRRVRRGSSHAPPVGGGALRLHSPRLQPLKILSFAASSAQNRVVLPDFVAKTPQCRIIVTVWRVISLTVRRREGFIRRVSWRTGVSGWASCCKSGGTLREEDHS